MVKRKLVLPMKRSSPASGTMPKIVVSGLVQWVSDLPSSERAPVFFLSGDQTLQGLSQYLAWSQMHPGAIDDVFGYAIRSWVRESLWESLLDRVRVAKPAFTERLPAWFPPEPEVWELLWGIGSVSEFVVEEPLRAIVDQKAYLAHEFYRLLWEVRFLVRENLNLSKAQSLVQNITKWAFGEGPPDRGFFSDYNVPVLDLTLSQRYDLLWMLLTVAHQNGLFTRYMIGMDGLSEALEVPTSSQEVETMISTLERWVLRGNSPVGVLILNFDAASSENLEKLHRSCPVVGRHAPK